MRYQSVKWNVWNRLTDVWQGVIIPSVKNFRQKTNMDGRGAVFISIPWDDLDQRSMDERGYRRRIADV